MHPTGPQDPQPYLDPELAASYGAGPVPGASTGPAPGALPSAAPVPDTQVLTADLPEDVLEAMGPDRPFVPPREPLGARLAGYFGRHQLLLFGLSLFLLWAMMALPFSTSTDILPGQLAKQDYVAPHNAYLPDKTETERRREAAAALVPPAYTLNPNAPELALLELRTLISRTRAAARAPEGKAPAPGNVVNGQLTPDLKVARKLSEERWQPVARAAEVAVRHVYQKGRIRSDVMDDWKNVRPYIAEALRPWRANGTLNPVEARLTEELAWRAAHVANVVVNERATEAARGEARAGVLPVYVRIEANTVLVREDQILTEEQWTQLQSLGLVTARFSWSDALAQLALCAMMVSAAAAYLARSRQDLLSRPAALWLVAVVPILFLLGFRFILRVPHGDYLMAPLAATAAMLITVLVDGRVGLATGFTVASLCALMISADAGLFFSSTLLTWIGALAVGRLPSRFALQRAFGLLAVSNASLAFAVGVLRGASPEELYSATAWSFGAGLAAVALMYALATSLERPFGITSHLRLLELLSPDENILRRMQTEAPGTYTHSLMVATLSETAAKQVSADPLLCRVGGLYHDIGKLRRPHCFIENQGGENIHDRLSPGLSALLIKAHVKDGLELGRALRLPQPVLEIIQEHHGTSLIAYFYHRAKEQAGKTGVEERAYRYAGPRPRSKECAIVMLADSVEASARALPQITQESLTAHIKGIIEARLREGELDDADLTLRELDIVREAFTTSLKGALHHRIEYPDPAALSGELRASTAGWVRETLGEKPEIAEKPAKKGLEVAISGQKRQNKEKIRGSRAEDGTSSNTRGRGDREPQPRDNEDDAITIQPETPTSSGGESRSAKRRRRRFKAPFYPSPSTPTPHPTPLHVESPVGPTSKSILPAKSGPTDHSGIHLESDGASGPAVRPEGRSANGPSPVKPSDPGPAEPGGAQSVQENPGPGTSAFPGTGAPSPGG